MKYNQNKKESSNQNLEIIYYKKYIQKNVGEMIYLNPFIDSIIKIFDNSFISNNIKRANIIINSKEYKLKEYIVYQKIILKLNLNF